jgi:PAS domain S-box-containing protein
MANNNSTLLARFRSLALASGLVVVLIGAAGLAGWLFDIVALKSVLPGLSSMKANTALGLTLAGAALLFAADEDAAVWRRRASLVCAAVVTLIGLLTLGQYLFGVDFGIDQALVRDLSSPPSLPPGRMGANTALCFALTGGALLLFDTRSRALAQLAQDMTILALLVALVALVGYAYSVAYLTRIASATQMATHTAVAFVALGVGLIVARPRRPFAAMLASASPGGVLLRRILPQVILLFVLLGWLRLEGERLGLYEHAFGTGLLVLAGIVLFALLIWRAARTLNRLEAERREAEASEREADARLRVTLRSIGDAVISTDTAGRVSFVNPVAESLTGWTLAEAEGRPLTEVFHIINEQTRAEVENPVTKVIREGAKVGLANHTVLVARDGREIPIDDSGAPIGDEAGEIVGAVLIFRDISERKRAEQALRESEERYRIVAETATDAIITIDEHSAILYVNPAAERVFGYRAEELIGQSLTKLMPEYLRHVHQAGMRRYLTTGERHLNWEHVEMPGLHRDGHEIPLELSFGELLTGGRRIFVGIARDATERKRAEERFRLVVESAPNALLLVNRDGQITLVNSQAERLFGYSREELAGATVEMLVPERFRSRHDDYRAGFFANPEARKMGAGRDLFGLRKDGGEVPVEIGLNPMKTAEGEFVLISVIDITERKRTEDLLRETEERFRATFEQAAVGIAQVAPDGRWLLVNQRLCEIVGYTQEELLARTFQDITHPDDLAADLDLVRQVLAGKIDTYSMEKRYIRKDGPIVWVNLTVALVRDATGAPKYFISVVEDITERKRVEQELAEGARQQQALYQFVDQLHHARSLDDVYNAALDAILSALQCDRASILLFDDTGVMRFVGSRGLSDVYRKAVEGHSPWKPDERNPKPVVVNDVGAAEIDASLKAVVEGEGIGALAFIPLVSRGKLIGKFMTYFNAPHVFSDDELELSLTIGRQLAFGIDRKRADALLRQYANQLALITDTAPVLIAQCDAQARFKFVNKAYAERFGLTPEDCVGKRVSEIVGEEAYRSIRQYIEVVLRGEPVEFEVEVPYAAIGEHFMHCSYAPEFDADGKVVGWVAAITDITERKRAEDSLRESENRFHSMADSSPTMIWLSGPDKLCTYFNKPWLDFTGRTMEQELGDGWAASIHPDDLDRCLETYATAFDAREEFEMEYRLRRRDGEYRWTLDRGVPLFTPAGGFKGYIGSCIDVHDRKQIEEQIKYQLDLTRTITDNSRSCLWMMDAEGRATFANPATERVTGFKPEELIGEVLHYKVHHTRPDGAPFPKEECPLDRALPLQESVVGYEDTFVHKDGHFYPVRCNGRPIFKGGKPVGTVIEVQDITEEKRLLEAERRAREQAEVANRLKDEFLATVSHELRTPLNAILGWTVMLRSGKLKPDKAAEALETIERSARAQNRLVEDLLDVSRIVTGRLQLKFQPVALAKVVEAAVAAARPAAEAKSIALQVVFDSLPCEVTGDADRLQQVIWNLISNAVKFTPRGGRVQAQLERAGSHVEIKVSDTGEGIAPEFLPHVFDRFRQADGSIQRRHGGLGLGLAIVRHLVELHGGEVSVESPGPGQGATFTVILPLAAAQAADLGMRDEEESTVRNLQSAISEAAPRLGGVKVLVVDDEADARALLMEILAGRGAEVRVASGMAEALSLLNEWRPDVLISDIGMPNGSGYDLIREVRRRDALGTRLPAVALTAYARPEDRVQALSAGFHMHVPKPIEPKELLAVIASLTG